MKNNKSAFTLVELMVVLAIIALLSALIFGAISSIREGNKRGSCQSNLNQIHAALRLYAQDNDGQFPYLNAATPPPPTGLLGGIGLFSLYVYRLPNGNYPRAVSDPNQPATLASYLKSPRAFHCPSDTGNTVIGTTSVSNGELEYVDSSGNRLINLNYLSYQKQDPDPAVSPLQSTYSTFRATDIKRQLGDYDNPTPSPFVKRAPDQTIVTWCHFHRSVDATTGAVKSPDKTFDNVLFLDGSVQSVPVEQTVNGVKPDGTIVHQYLCRSWGRVPLAEANSTPDAVLQQFVTAGVCTAS